MTEKKTDPEFTMFAEVHALYPGLKRFVATEFKNLKLHKDWKEVLPQLKGALQNQINYRKTRSDAGAFVPEWKHMSKWIEGRWFEESVPVAPSVQKPVDKIPHF